MINWLEPKQERLDPLIALNYLAHSLATNKLTNGGPCVARLEDTLGMLLDVSSDRAVIVTSSGTSALHALVGAIMLERGEMIFANQAFTFPSTAQQILSHCPLIDIDFNGGADLSLLDPEMDGLIVTNCFGHLTDLEIYEDYAQKNEFTIIFDNAGTPATYYQGVNSINFGTGAAISLHHTKPIGFGEGGAVIVNKTYEMAVRRIINFGLDRERGLTGFTSLGGNHKMPETSAAFLLAFLRDYKVILKSQKLLYDKFSIKLKSLSQISLFPNSGDSPFANCLPLLFPYPVSEDFFIDRGIAARKYYKPLEPLPISMDYYSKIICLPLHPALNEADLDYYLNTLDERLNLGELDQGAYFEQIKSGG
jgi:dTDP-4-amino-4,6-dideoxygalactose transaminase